MVLELWQDKENGRNCIKIGGEIDEENEWHYFPCGVLFLKMHTHLYTTRHYAFDALPLNNDIGYLCQYSEFPAAEDNNSFDEFIRRYLNKTLEMHSQRYHIQLTAKNTPVTMAEHSIVNTQSVNVVALHSDNHGPWELKNSLHWFTSWNDTKKREYPRTWSLSCGKTRRMGGTA